MNKKLENGQLQAHPPSMTNGEFLQSFTFRANVKIGQGAIQQITQSLMAAFQRSLEMNKFEQFSWPPKRVELTPHADFMGFEATLGTLAREPGMVIIQTRH